MQTSTNILNTSNSFIDKFKSYVPKFDTTVNLQQKTKQKQMEGFLCFSIAYTHTDYLKLHSGYILVLCIFFFISIQSHGLHKLFSVVNKTSMSN